MWACQVSTVKTLEKILHIKMVQTLPCFGGIYTTCLQVVYLIAMALLLLVAFALQIVLTDASDGNFISFGSTAIAAVAQQNCRQQTQH